MPASSKPRRFWTPIELEMVRLHYPDSRTDDLALVLDRSRQQVSAQARKMGVAKTAELLAQQAREILLANPDHGAHHHRFQPGIVPANKGIRRPGWAPGRMVEHQFKAGNKPVTWVPVGTYRVSSDGVFERKFSDDPGPPTARWRAVARLVWEDFVFGPIPPGHIVVFRKGMKPERIDDLAAYTVDRLECISRSENLRRNSYHQYGPELARMVQLRGVLTRVIRNRERKEADRGQDQQ